MPPKRTPAERPEEDGIRLDLPIFRMSMMSKFPVIAVHNETHIPVVDTGHNARSR